MCELIRTRGSGDGGDPVSGATRQEVPLAARPGPRSSQGDDGRHRPGVFRREGRNPLRSQVPASDPRRLLGGR